MKRQITIFGATGYSNVGDDLIAAVLREMLLRSIPDIDITIVPHYRRELIERSDVVIVGGGGLIYDYDPVNVTNYTEIILRAQEQVIPVFMAGIGVQHVFSEKSKELYRDALRFVEGISLRNDHDAEYVVSELHCRPETVIRSRDLAFLGTELFPVQPVAPKGDKKVIVLSLANWQLGAKNYNRIDPALNEAQKAYLQYVREQIGVLTDTYEVKLVCQAAEDRELYEGIVEKHPTIELVTFEGIEDSHEIYNVFAGADVVVTGRYHGLIAGLIVDTPTIAVSFGGHKQQKLITDSYPSLSKQLYTVEQMVQQDLFVRLLDDTFVSSLQVATAAEQRQVRKLARQNYRLVKMIAGSLAKM